jgi:glycosyltransferase involved in cell wall biosynthesis
MATWKFATAGEKALFVDASPLFEKQLTGIGRFVLRLMEAISPKASLRLFGDRLSGEIAVERGTFPNVDLCGREAIRRILSRPRCPIDHRAARRSAAIYTALRPDRRRFRRELAILYDFTSVLFPWCHNVRTCESFGAYYTQTASLCDKLLAISRSTRNDARWLLSRPEGDVAVGYPGPSLCVDHHACDEQTERRSDVLLLVSTLEPRKNIAFVLDWFLQSKALKRAAELWCVGPKGWWATGDFMRQLTSKRLPGRCVRFLGMVPDRKLCKLYQQATATIYPSLYEGFGFPVLDSLMHETPVLCSFNSSLQEFDGSGVHYFDPADLGSLDEAFARFSNSPKIGIKPESLRERFCWKNLAEKILALSA